MDRKYKKIVVLDSVIFFPEHRERLRRICEELVEYDTCKTEEEVLERVRGADCIISCWVDVPNRVLDENPQLRTVAFWTHAFEHRIDIDYARARNIFVPSIPDYGTDSVAELVFIGLLHLYSNRGGAISFGPKSEPQTIAEAIMARVADDVRCFGRNVKANLDGSWTHEYIKAGKLRLTSADDFEEQTLKGLTLGLLAGSSINQELLTIAVGGFRMNAIYSLCDLPYALDLTFRPIEELLTESHVVIYDSRTIPAILVDRIRNGRYLSTVDVASVSPSTAKTIFGRKLGIVGLGRIGTRVVQIARDGFAMDVRYHSRNVRPEIDDHFGIRSVGIQQILTESDVITFHLPHVGAEEVITREMVDLIPRQTTVVNVSVGNIFQDQRHLLARFAEADLNGYIDVYSGLPPKIELRGHKQYLLSTYRLGWRTKSTVGLKTHKLITKLENGLKH